MRSHFFLLLQEKVLYEINKLIIDNSKEDVCFIFSLTFFTKPGKKISLWSESSQIYSLATYTGDSTNFLLVTNLTEGQQKL